MSGSSFGESAMPMALPAETVTVAFLNTRFGEAFKNRETLEQVLPMDAGRLALVGFSEVTRGVRADATFSILDRGYSVMTPASDQIMVDTLWAASPGLTLEPESQTQVFPARIASRPGRRQRRDAGVQTVAATTLAGYRLRASTERLAPPMLGRRARLRQLGHMADVLEDVLLLILLMGKLCLIPVST